jgi:hypothetical protein
MEIPLFYNQERFIHEAVGNNAFDYSQRCESNPEPYLRIAPLKSFATADEALNNFKLNHLPAFELSEDNQIKSFYGLENFLLFPCPDSKAPVFVFDNHNHAFFFWHWWASQNSFTQPLTLIHVDQHKDTRIPATFLSASEAENLPTLNQYTTEILNVGNFIPPAIKTGLLSTEIKFIDSSTSLEDLAQNPLPENYILDIDLDFFAPDLDYLNNQLKLKAIKKALPLAKIITIASSPYFIDQQLAFKFLREIFAQD